jgi:hypothetical protein
MRTFLRFVTVAVFALPLLHSALAEEKNGLSVVVSKTVIENNDSRNTSSYYDRINRTQGLKAAIKNLTFKPMPEGELVWTILVKKADFTDYTISYSGVEKLKALKPAETENLIFGNANVGGYRDLGSSEKDKVEWQVIVKQEGKELLRAQSTSSFDSMAKRATKATASGTGGS